MDAQARSVLIGDLSMPMVGSSQVNRAVPHRRAAYACTGDIKKAKDAGYHTCNGMIMYTKKVAPGMCAATVPRPT